MGLAGGDGSEEHCVLRRCQHVRRFRAAIHHVKLYRLAPGSPDRLEFLRDRLDDAISGFHQAPRVRRELRR